VAGSLRTEVLTNIAMLKSLKIRDFRRFRELGFAGLKRVNLIAGKNNTGKTAVLEALLLLLEGGRARESLPRTFRNCEKLANLKEAYWKWLFYAGDMGRPAVVTAETEEGESWSVAVSAGALRPGYTLSHFDGLQLGVEMEQKSRARAGVPACGLPGCVALSVRQTDPGQDAEEYDRVVLKAGGEERLEGLLRRVEPRLKGVRSIRPHGATLIYLDLGLPEKIPAMHLGQGFMRLLKIYSELLVSGKQVLLIDEFENGLHYSALRDVWRGVMHLAAQENVQVFATTHSYECIRAAHQTFAESSDYDFALHRLDEVGGEIVVRTYDRETLETSLASNFETR